MSIVPLVKVTIFGMLEEKEQILADLQKLGFIHLIPARPSGEEGRTTAVSPGARRALAFLLSCPHRRSQVHHTAAFDAEKLQARALELESMLHTLGDQRDHLTDRIKNLRPWGEFRLPPLEELRNLRLWFYEVPHHLMQKVEAADLNWAVAGKDEHFLYVVVVSEEEPQGMPVARTLIGDRPLSALEQRLIEVENEIEDIEAERYSMTRWCNLYSRSLNRIEDRDELERAKNYTDDMPPLFVLQGWVPGENLDTLITYSEKHNLALEARKPLPDETPPSLLRNPPDLSSGQDLVSFYMTPNYWLSDPSLIVFFSFVLFFAMILADAGYALVLGIGLFFIWTPMGSSLSGRRMRILLATIVVASAIYGVLVGSYFGVEPEKGTTLGDLKILDLNNHDLMMTLTIFIGAFHVILANLMVILRKGFTNAALAPLGWIMMIIGAILLVKCGGPAAAAGQSGIGLMAGGALLVLLFSGAGLSPVKRILHGLERLTKIANAFGDIMSYLRLFALGLASASLAVAFNDLARQASEAVISGMSAFVLVSVLLIGHSINLILGIMGGVVHGLRLNLIEFLNWSTPEEGYPFRAFARKEEV